MIELLRYARLKPDGLASAEARPPDNELGAPHVAVIFKRFSVENGKEIPPEASLVVFEDLERRQAELRTELEVVQELLALKPK